MSDWYLDKTTYCELTWEAWKAMCARRLITRLTTRLTTADADSNADDIYRDFTHEQAVKPLEPGIYRLDKTTHRLRMNETEEWLDLIVERKESRP